MPMVATATLSAINLTTAPPRVKTISVGVLTKSAYLESKNCAHENSTPVLLFADRKPFVNCLTPKESAYDSYRRSDRETDYKHTLVIVDSENPVNHDGCDWYRVPNRIPKATIENIPSASDD